MDNNYLNGLQPPDCWIAASSSNSKTIEEIEIVEKRIAFLKTCGLNALECFYSLYNYQEIEMIKKLADKYDLLLSAGSDYHGKNKAVKIGETSAENYNFSVKNVTILKALLKSD